MKILKQPFFSLIILMLVGCMGQQTQIVKTPEMTSTSTISTTVPFLDFDHPRLHEIAGNGPLIIDEIERTQEKENEYVAVIVRTNDPIFKQELLVFYIADNVSTLIYDLGPFYFMSLAIEVESDPVWLYNGWALRSYHGILYHDKNSFLMPVLISNGGNCYDCASLRLINISGKDNVTDITPITKFNPKGFVDVGELDFRILATQYYESDYGACSRANSPFAFRLFKWQGATYVDVSEFEKDFYNQKIADLVIQLQKYWGKPLNACLVMPILANIFFNYESSGRIDYGWDQIQMLGDLGHWDIQNTSPDEIQTYHDVFGQLKQRKNESLVITKP
jgi:hypothetical protein